MARFSRYLCSVGLLCVQFLYRFTRACFSTGVHQFHAFLCLTSHDLGLNGIQKSCISQNFGLHLQCNI